MYTVYINADILPVFSVLPLYLFYTNNPSTCSAFIKPSFIVNPPNTLSTFILPCIGCYKIGQALSPHSQTSCPAI